MDLGTRIQTLRKAQGLSQEALADKLGVSRQAIGKWESGSTSPSIDNLLELSVLLNTTVDYLLTGREPESGPETPSGEETVPLEALRQLLGEQKPKAHRKRRGFALGALVILLLGILIHYNSRVRLLEHQVNGLSGQVSSLTNQLSSAVGNIQYNIEETISQQNSLLTTWDVGYGEYDTETNTAQLILRATPKTLTEDTELQFVLSPVGTESSTLEEPISVEGIPNGSGSFTAEIPTPMVEAFTVTILLHQDGVQYTELLYTEYYFSQNYVCSLSLDWGDFGWSSTTQAWDGDKATVSLTGTPICTVIPSTNESAPKPQTLLCRLYLNGTVVEAENFDVYQDLYGMKEENETGELAEPVYDISYYPGFHQERTYTSQKPDPQFCWEFILTDTAGNEIRDTMTWD